MTDGWFDYGSYTRFLAEHAAGIAAFRSRQAAAFAAEKERWRASGEFDRADPEPAASVAEDDIEIPERSVALRAPFTASVWQVAARPGDRVAKGDKLVSLEAMKMETILTAPHDGTVAGLYVAGRRAGDGRAGAGRGAARRGHGRGGPVNPVAATPSSGSAPRTPRSPRRAGRRSGSRCGPQARPWRRRQKSTPGLRTARTCRWRAWSPPSRTTSTWRGCPPRRPRPRSAYQPEEDATAVARLRAAGAVVLGKTNLDQFATGLVGTRSPYGAVRNAWDPARISGGSSAGSAVAVALGLVDLALGTDTAGSGRVPAALNGVVGVKPTRGVVPATGVVPACRSLDCVTVFARSLDLARKAVAVMAGPDGRDPLATLLGDHPRGAWRLPPGGGAPRVAVPLPAQLDGLADGWAEAFAAAVARLRAAGAETAEVDIAPLLDAAALLYGGAFVAERYAAVGAHIAAHTDLIGTDLDPVVARIILDGARSTAAELFADQEKLDRLAAQAAAALDGFDALLTPATTAHPTLAEVAADPVGVNAGSAGTPTSRTCLTSRRSRSPAGTVARAAVRGHAHRPGSAATRGSPRSPRATTRHRSTSSSSARTCPASR